MTRIGIMQGRLLPPVEGRIQCFPRNNWAMEFSLATQIQLDCIEWIYDLYGADVNPLATDAGIDNIKALSAQYGVKVPSVCADYFMDRPFIRADTYELDERLGTLHWLFRRCQLLGMNRLVLPFVDSSRIETDVELDSVVSILERTLPIAEETGVEIHLETSLAPDRFAELLRRLPHPMIKVNYDSGNSSSLGYHPRDEFAAYGARVGSVHIKDRIRGGSTVPLGTGDADLPALFDCLKTVDYSGDLVLQVARAAPNDEFAWAKRNRNIVLNYLDKANLYIKEKS
jgi:L-ribulose-5-phosphate 3-epimerase